MVLGAEEEGNGGQLLMSAGFLLGITTIIDNLIAVNIFFETRETSLRYFRD